MFRRKGSAQGGPKRANQIFVGAPRGSHFEKGPSIHTEEAPGRPKTEAEGPWENKGQRFSISNRSKNKKISDLSRPGPLARRISYDPVCMCCSSALASWVPMVVADVVQESRW